MSLDLSNTLVVGISATALFDLAEADQLYREQMALDPAQGLARYRDFMLKTEQKDLPDGTGMPLVRALLDLNRFRGPGDAVPLVEVVVMSRNSPETGMRVLNNIRRRQLAISRHAFTGGGSVVGYLDAFDVDLFLTTHVDDAQAVIDARQCAAAVLKPPPRDLPPLPIDQVRIAFDGDAVLFDESSELVYKTQGLPQFQRNEDEQQNVPLPEGPYAVLLTKLAQLQRRLPFAEECSPVRIGIVTARSAPAELRVINTLRHWGVVVNEIFFLGGVEKARVLKAFRPHIFFDDQDVHLEPASRVVAAGQVPYRSDSPLRRLQHPESHQ